MIDPCRCVSRSRVVLSVQWRRLFSNSGHSRRNMSLCRSLAAGIWLTLLLNFVAGQDDLRSVSRVIDLQQSSTLDANGASETTW